MDSKGFSLGLLLDDSNENEEVIVNLQLALWQGKAFRSRSKISLTEYIAGFLGHAACECVCFAMSLFFWLMFCSPTIAICQCNQFPRRSQPRLPPVTQNMDTQQLNFYPPANLEMETLKLMASKVDGDAKAQQAGVAVNNLKNFSQAFQKALKSGMLKCRGFQGCSIFQVFMYIFFFCEWDL